MGDFYHSIKEIETLNHLLQDPLSHEIFWARLRYDVECSLDNALQLFKLTGMISAEEFELQKNWRKRFQELNRDGKQILLYGCGVGRAIAELILYEQEDFFGFCDRDATKYQDGIFGKPVFPPGYVLEHKDECYVLITTIDYYFEIYQFLIENKFPEQHILPYFCKPRESFSKLMNQQYFDFPECYLQNTVFIDAGCFNCQTSIRFAEWCSGKYSKIIALEPDDKNFLSCKTMVQTRPIERMELIHAGLSNVSGTAKFSANANSSSFLIEGDCSREMQKLGHISGNVEEIHTVALDDMDIGEKIGFIKMDIEGAEYQALQGAKRTLLRDKPLLAISVYHRKGDVLAIMDYLHETVPEYRFWLRHYSPIGLETVLYAAI